MLMTFIVHKINRHRLFLTSLFIVLSSGCTTSTIIPPQPASQLSSLSVEDAKLGDLLTLTQKADALPSPEREQQLLLIAEKLAYQYAQWEDAKQPLEKIRAEQLSNAEYIRFVLVAGNAALATLSLSEARSLAFSKRTSAVLDSLSLPQKKQVRSMRAQIYEQLGEATSSINESIALGLLLSETDETQQNNDAIWQQLSTLALDELYFLSQSKSNGIFNGWVNLATASKQAQNSIEAQQQAIATWRTTHPNHPANQYLPEELRSLTNILENRPRHIALLLPLRGRLSKAGQAIRDGFMAAYYNSQDEQYDTPIIRFYDTSSEDIQQVYNEAVTNGATLVIGPLVKNRVESLQQLLSIPIPILALNYLENDNVEDDEIQRPFYQFGLSLEDEAVQVADRAWLEGHRNAMILSSSANWSQRAADAFVQRWLSYGGKIIANTLFDKSGNYSAAIEQTLHIERSKQRATTLKRLFGRSFEFEPRRRRDIDMIFLLAQSKEGRQIKPTLDFHYAADIPVYATSQIYSSVDSKDKNTDLNGIKLTTLPWIISNSIKEKQLIRDHISITPGYERLYALGADSFLLYPRVLQLEKLDNYEIYGSTGQLSMANKRIKRRQVWATIMKGEIRVLRALTLPSKSAL